MKTWLPFAPVNFSLGLFIPKLLFSSEEMLFRKAFITSDTLLSVSKRISYACRVAFIKENVLKWENVSPCRSTSCDRGESHAQEPLRVLHQWHAQENVPTLRRTFLHLGESSLEKVLWGERRSSDFLRGESFKACRKTI